MQQWGKSLLAMLHLHGGISGPGLKHQPHHICVTAPGCADSHTKSTMTGVTDFLVLTQESWLRDGQVQLDLDTREMLFIRSPVG